MSKEKIKYLLSLYEKPIVFHPVFARMFGGVNEALFLQQILYWSDKGRDKNFIYKTKNELEEETTLTPRQQDPVRKKLQAMGVIDIKKKKVGGGPVLHYKLILDELEKRIMEYYKTSDSSYSENTSEKYSSKEEITSSEKTPEEKSYRFNDPRVAKIEKYFVTMCEKEIGTKPVFGVAQRSAIARSLKTAGLSEEQVTDLLDEWFSLGKPDEETVQITRALSYVQINAYRARNGIK